MNCDCTIVETKWGDEVKLCPLHAAAPGLLEALRPLAEQDCESWGCDCTVGYKIKRFPDHDCSPRKARAAITKATT